MSAYDRLVNALLTKRAKSEEEEAEFTDEYDDDPRLKGDQDELPDFLQEKILKAAAAKKKKKDSRLANAGVSGYNKPKRTPNHPTKSHIVVAKKGDKVKTIRFGQQGVRTNQTAGQRKAFKSRHGKNIAKGNMSAAYWANKVKWSPSKTKNKKSQKWVKGTKTAAILRLITAIKEAAKKKPSGTATKRDPKLWAAAKSEAKRRMGGKHSARAMQLATQIYKKRGGKYKGKKPTAKNNKLKNWGKQDWQWSSKHRKKSAAEEKKDKKETKGKGVYLPKKKLDALKSSKKGKSRLAAAVRKKTKATRKGEQYSSHGLAKGTSKLSALLKMAHKCRGDILEAFKAEGGALSMDALLKRTKNQPEKEVRKELQKLKDEGIVKDHIHGDMYTTEKLNTKTSGLADAVKTLAKNKRVEDVASALAHPAIGALLGAGVAGEDNRLLGGLAGATLGGALGGRSILKLPGYAVGGLTGGGLMHLVDGSESEKSDLLTNLQLLTMK